jgi:hypothetical protein
LADRALWDTILPHLRTLWIVADQPANYDFDWPDPVTMAKAGAISWAEEMALWTNLLSPFLECLAKTLPVESTDLFDVNEKEETRELIQKYLLHRCRQVRTHDGDFIFRRGGFLAWFNANRTPL